MFVTKDKNILVFEDQDEIVTLYYEIFAETGWEVIDGYSYLLVSEGGVSELINGVGNFQMAIVDLVMPLANGLDIILELRKQNFNGPILVASGYADKYTEETQVYPNLHFLPKPFTAPQLLEKIDEILAPL